MDPHFIGLCELSLNPSSMGLWTVYQEPYDLDGKFMFDGLFILLVFVYRCIRIFQFGFDLLDLPDLYELCLTF